MTSKQIAIGAALFTACLAGSYFYAGTSPGPEQASPAIVDGAFPVPAQIPGQKRATSASEIGGSLPFLTERMANPLERAGDLRAMYEQYKSSKDGLERNTAYRAWSACFPTFIAPQGQTVPIENLARALPPNDPNRANRADAYRNLLGRCKHFADMSREEIVRETQIQKNAWVSGDAQAPGERATKAHIDGNTDDALGIARAVIASGDPYAVNSLREFIDKYFWDHNDLHPDQFIERPDLRALAFAVAACQLGLECGPGSLTALQLCANTGKCAGSVADRYMQSLSSQSDRDALQKESRRVADAIKAGDYRALGF